MNIQKRDKNLIQFYQQKCQIQNMYNQVTKVFRLSINLLLQYIIKSHIMSCRKNIYYLEKCVHLI